MNAELIFSNTRMRERSRKLVGDQFKIDKVFSTMVGNKILKFVFTGGCGDRKYECIQKGLDKFLDNRSVKRNERKKAGL